MDDRTIIAKDVLCAILSSDKDWRRYERDGNTDDAVKYADSLLATLAIKGSKDDPNPETVTKGPRWRKMNDLPCVVGFFTIGNVAGSERAFTAYFRDSKWFEATVHGQVNPEPLFFNMHNRRWLDLNGFHPTE